MDLRTVTQRFKDKKYKTVEAVLNDIQIIWDNCKLYNSKNSVPGLLTLGYLQTGRSTGAQFPQNDQELSSSNEGGNCYK